MGIDCKGTGRELANGEEVGGVTPHPPPVTVQLPREWVTAALSGQGNVSPEKASIDKKAEISCLMKQKWSGMRLVDTVRLDGSGDVESWVLTTKAGHITTKKGAQDRAKVVERFERFALANPKNKEGYVTLVESRSSQMVGQQRVVLDRVALREAMLESRVSEQLKDTTLQCFLRPQKGTNSYLRARYIRKGKIVSLVTVRPLYLYSFAEAVDAVEGRGSIAETQVVHDTLESENLRNELLPVLQSLVNHVQQWLSDLTTHIISECKVDLVVDDNGELWLISIPHVTAIATSEEANVSSHVLPSTSPISAVNGGEIKAMASEIPDDEAMKPPPSSRMPPLVTAFTRAPLEGSGSSFDSSPLPSSSSRQTASSCAPRDPTQHQEEVNSSPREGMLPAISTMLGARSAEGDHNDLERKRRKQVPIIELKNGVYVARVHASALRGLCCWREGPARKLGDSRERDSPRWHLVESRYKGNLDGEERRGVEDAAIDSIGRVSSPSRFDALSKMRLKMTARSVLLAMAASSFLLGEEPWTTENLFSGEHERDGGSLAQRWRACDEGARLLFANANPQAYYEEVTACGNCVEICRKLDSIRAAGYPDGAIMNMTEALHKDNPDQPRPSSEPPPSVVPATAGEKRPGITQVETETLAIGSARKDRQDTDDGESKENSAGEKYTSRDRSSIFSSSGDMELEDDVANARNSEESRAGLSGSGQENTTKAMEDIPPDQMERSREKSCHDTRRERANAKILGRLSTIYRGGEAKSGRGSKLKSASSRVRASRRGKARATSETDIRNVGLDLPCVAAVARFAVERERLAREMELDTEDSASLEVVNVGAQGCGRQRDRKKSSSSKQRRTQRVWGIEETGDGAGTVLRSESGAKRGVSMGKNMERSGEALLETLELVAEARSIEYVNGDHGSGLDRSQHYGSPAEASLSSEVQHGTGGSDETLPPPGEISSSESAFLERSRRLGPEGRGMPGVRSASLFRKHFEEGFCGGRSGGDMDEAQSGNNATITALRDRLAVVEAENTALRTRARRAEEERAAEANRSEKATKKLTQARLEFSRAMSEKDEDNRRRELALEEKHFRELARKSTITIEEITHEVSANPVNEGGDGNAPGPGQRESSTSKGLIMERLNQALTEIGEQQRSFARIKRALLAEKVQEVAAAEAKVRRELEETRSLAAAMEERTSSLQEQVSEAAKQISTLRAREEEQIRRRKKAEEDATRIQKEIGLLRQAVHASQSMDVVDESGGRRDGQSTLASVTATSEARIRTLNNKVEFLKAQLSSEQTLKAEVEAALALTQKSLFEAKDSSRKQAAEAEKAKEAAVEETASRVQRQVEESTSETYRAQSKVQTLQSQLSDALEDLTMARRREESLKMELAQATARLEDRGMELAKAQSRADDLAQAKAADTESSAARAAREALVRRLDNERQYLKSQLQSEITCKDELRETLATATRQLGEIKADWAEEQATRTETFQRELKTKTDELSDLNSEKIATEAELVAATRKLSLLKEGYAKARDTLRAEQSALETVRTANRRLREEVKASAEELEGVRVQAGEEARRQSEGLVAAKTALDEVEESKHKQSVDHQAQFREQLLKTSEAQRQLMKFQTHLQEREGAFDRTLAAERLGEGFARWLVNRKASAFYRIVGGVVIAAAENDVRERTRKTLREAGEAARRVQTAAVEEAVRTALIQAEDKLEEAKRVASEERAVLLRDSEDAAMVIAAQSQTIKELRALEAVTTQELENNREELKEISRRHKEQMEQTVQQAKKRTQAEIEAAILSTKEACAEAGKKTMEEADEKWRTILREHLKKAAEEAAAAASVASREHDALVKETQEAFREERNRLLQEAEILIASAVEEERKRGIQRETEARACGVAEAKAAAAAARKEDRLKADEELKVALAKRTAETAAEARAAEAEARRKAVQETAAAKEELERELSAARERAVKLEGGKWQRASEEAGVRAAAENAAAYERGMTDRGRRAEVEAAQLHDAAEKALEEVKQGATTTMQEMTARHAKELKAERKRVSEEADVNREKALKAAHEAWAQEQTKAVANARAAATAEARVRSERERTAAVEAATEREKLATEKVRNELRSAKNEWTAERHRIREKVAALEDAEQKANAEAIRSIDINSQATQRARVRWEEGQKVAMERAAAEAVEDKEKALQEACRAFNREKKRALMESEEVFTVQAEAMVERLRKQAIASLQEAQAAQAETHSERDRLATELEQCRTTIQELEVIISHTRADGREQAMSYSVLVWRLVAADLRRELSHKKTVEQACAASLEQEAAAEHERLVLSTNLEEILKLALDWKRRFSEMRETLVNYKREVLIDHKIQSANLHQELDGLAKDRNKLEEERLVLQREFQDLEGQAKQVEKEAHAHSRQSAIGPDGMIIPARARKKRRLDEELEALLEAMEAKRRALAAADGKLVAMANARSVKDNEMKGLERTLVEVLVEQQKKILVLLSEIGDEAERLEGINSRTRSARDEAQRRKTQQQTATGRKDDIAEL